MQQLLLRSRTVSVRDLVCNFKITGKMMLLGQFQNNVQYSIMENFDESDCYFESRKECREFYYWNH
jgi:hypothetical protein